MPLRKISSLTSLLSFILLAATSVILFVAPTGRRSGQWEFWSMSKEEWAALHTNLGFLFLVAAIVHILLNLVPIVSYLKNRQKKLQVFTMSFNISLIIPLLIVAGTLFSLPPVNLIQQYRASRKGIMSDSPLGGSSCGSCEKATATAPAPGVPAAAGTVEMPADPGRRFGRKTMEDLCAEYGLDAPAIAEGLKKLGVTAAPADSMRAIGEANAMNPSDIYGMIRQLAMPATDE